MSDSASGKAFDLGLFRRVMSFVRPYRGAFWWAFALTILLSIVGVVRPIVLGWVVDIAATDYAKIITVTEDDGWGKRAMAWTARTIADTVGEGTAELLWWVTIIVVVLLILETVMQLYQAFLTNWLGQSVMLDLRDKLYRHVVQFRLRYFDRTPIGTLVTRVVSDMETIEDIFSQGLLMILGDLLKLVVVILVMFVYDWQLALLSLLPVPLLLWATNIFKNSIRKSFQDVRTQVARLNAFVQEHIQGMSIVQLFGKEKEEMKKFEAINEEHNDANIRSVWAYSVFFPVVEILAALSIALLVWWGVKGMLTDDVTYGDVVAYIMFIQLLYRPIRQLADRFNVLQMGMVGSERVFKVLDTQAVIPDEGTFSTDGLRGDVEVRGLWFAYEDHPGSNGQQEPSWVLKDITFSAKAGEMVALVGATGSGKSSIVNVLSRAYEFQRGAVLVDGRDILTYKLDGLRRCMSVVPQDVFLFSDTVHNNITLHDDSISREEVMEAAKAVGAHDFIMQLPEGYDTSVRERGSVLSTGQRQLIAFIRAYVHKPVVLILDEATSSVDSLSEQLITQATERITKGRTSIVIAHRLSTVQFADRIIVLDKGRIIEQGSHQELLAYGGAYKRLYDLQFR
ncbi:MAG: ABC transporter ATP-binding protein [Flavobacteriales bacterium]|nr:MAG: ABC transporter ATP-binding protein [Flavobacteriales bacterium]